MTPDLPIPEAARESLATYLHDEECGCDWLEPRRDDPPHFLAQRERHRQYYEKLATEGLAAALPHLRSLQVETQVEYGRALGCKEAGEEIAARLEAIRDQIGDGQQRELAHDMASIARYVASQPQNATSEPRTDPPAHSGHPQDSQTAKAAPAEDCTCPPHMDGIGREKWPDCPIHMPREAL